MWCLGWLYAAAGCAELVVAATDVCGWLEAWCRSMLCRVLCATVCSCCFGHPLRELGIAPSYCPCSPGALRATILAT